MLAATAQADELTPDDPSIAGDLAVWLNDAANQFDPETGTWSDSSGNDRHAVPVGLVNIAGSRDFLAPVLATTSGGEFSVDDLPSLHFTGTVNDLMMVDSINGGNGLSDLTIFVVYNVDPLAAISSQVRPAGIGSVSAIQNNLGNNFNLGSDPSIRKDNGQLGSGTYSQAFPNQTTFIRTARMASVPDAIDEWFNLDGTPQKVLAITGSSFTTSTDDFFLGDLRAGAQGTPGVAGGNPAIADFDIVQALVYTSALSDQEVADVNEWLSKHPSGAGGGGAASELAVTEIVVAANGASVDLTWTSKPGRVYAVDLSYDLQEANWQELNDEIDSGGSETSASVPTFPGQEPPDPLPERVYFRVREV